MKWRLLRRRLLQAQVMPGGTFLLESGSPAYVAAMESVHWGKPRGYCVTWRQKTMKPHLYTPSGETSCA